VFLNTNKKFSKRKALAFYRDRCCHLALCLQLILFHFMFVRKAVFLLAKFNKIVPVTVKHDSHCWTCLGWDDTNRNGPIGVASPMVARANTVTCRCHWHYPNKCRQCKLTWTVALAQTGLWFIDTSDFILRACINQDQGNLTEEKGLVLLTSLY
jgi:hypothetical protein